MVHNHQSRAGSLAQSQQGLAQRGHGAGIVFILIVRGIERVDNDHFGICGPRGSHKMMLRILCPDRPILLDTVWAMERSRALGLIILNR
jgi:hypothetical protein